eukprot:TRINITY_DN4977_c0_g1_i1.p1 TRINITY_DN4977_c0_g1~~TRINITY_DN4977_c0_g1_i1.p1  ORF type:complete len:288 (-),score=26.80 TRINITY_DN4977_c0_g1_i1:425-1288(-)
MDKLTSLVSDAIETVTTVSENVQDVVEKTEEALGVGVPTANVTSIYFSSIDLKKAELVVEVLVTNPNSIAIPLTDISYLLDSNEKKIVSGSITDAGTIPANGSETIKVPVTVVYEDLMAISSDMKAGTVIPIRFKVEMIADVTGLGKITLPIEQTAEIPIPYTPEIDLEKITLDKFSFEETVMTIHLKLESKTDFDMIITAVDYQVSLAGNDIGGGGITVSTKTDESGISYIDLPMNFRPKDYGTALWDIIRGTGTGYAIEGNITLDTPFGSMKLPISKEGSTTLFK